MVQKMKMYLIFNRALLLPCLSRRRERRNQFIMLNYGDKENLNIHGFRRMILIQQNGIVLPQSLNIICSCREKTSYTAIYDNIPEDNRDFPYQ